uniref:Uncharacterized protein n=1 Tax=Romanomermis culicivorax TaxID=13658 RepID=A0A915I3V0_ROMCU
ESQNNCILNSESATTQPTLFTDEATDKVTYFEPQCSMAKALRDVKITSKKTPAKAAPNKTPAKAPTAPKRPKRQAAAALTPTRHRNVIWPNKPDWGSWTRCDGKSSQRFHFRNCKSYNPNKCEKASEQCDPNNSEIFCF